MDPFFVQSAPGGLSGSTKRTSPLQYASTIPSPFLDYASFFLPTNLLEAFEVAELMFYTNRTFAQAVEYVCAYFTGTDITINADDEDKANEYKKYLKEKLHLQEFLFNIGRDLKVYGNSFVSVLAPFDRHLGCKNCKTWTPARQIDYKFTLREGFQFKCPRCNADCRVMDPDDRPSMDENKVVLKRWPVKCMRIAHQPYSTSQDYYMEVPNDDKNHITEGRKWFLDTVPWAIVQAVRNNKMFKFNDGMVHHLSQNNLSDIRMGAWGLPPVIAGFRDAYMVQLLKRSNATAALDAMMPSRLITPATPASAGSPLQNTNLGDFGRQVMAAVSRSRQDPTSWQFIPTPIDYHLLNGEGRQLITPELLEYAQGDFLNGLGVPAEMYRKNLSVQQAPFAARLFEAGETVFLSALTQALSWIVDRVSAILNWSSCETILVRPTHADDMERRMILLQLMLQGVTAEQDVLSLFNLDWKESYKKRMSEEEYKMREEKKQRDRLEAMESNQQIMGPPPGAAIMGPGQPAPGMAGSPIGGAPAGPGGGGGGGGQPMMPVNGVAGPTSSGPGADLDSFFNDASARAQYIMQNAPLGSPQRRKLLSEIKNQDPNLHTMVKQLLDTATADAEAQGRDQMRGQPPQ